MYVLHNYLKTFHIQPDNGHYKASKYVVVPYVENTSYSNNKYCCVRRVNTLYIPYLVEHNRMTNLMIVYLKLNQFSCSVPFLS